MALPVLVRPPTDRRDLRIPREAGHRFHGKLDTVSTGNWTPIPREAGHRFHGKLDTPLGWPDLRGVLTEADAG